MPDPWKNAYTGNKAFFVIIFIANIWPSSFPLIPPTHPSMHSLFLVQVSIYEGAIERGGGIKEGHYF